MLPRNFKASSFMKQWRKYNIDPPNGERNFTHSFLCLDIFFEPDNYADLHSLFYQTDKPEAKAFSETECKNNFGKPMKEVIRKLMDLFARLAKLVHATKLVTQDESFQFQPNGLRFSERLFGILKPGGYYGMFGYFNEERERKNKAIAKTRISDTPLLEQFERMKNLRSYLELNDEAAFTTKMKKLDTVEKFVKELKEWCTKESAAVEERMEKSTIRKLEASFDNAKRELDKLLGITSDFIEDKLYGKAEENIDLNIYTNTEFARAAEQTTKTDAAGVLSILDAK